MPRPRAAYSARLRSRAATTARKKATAATATTTRRTGLARLLVWNDRPDFVPSLCDERGAFLTPGLFTGVRGPRAQTACLAKAQLLAQCQGSPFFAFFVEASLAMDAPAGSAGSGLAGSLDLDRLSRRREAEVRSLLGLAGDTWDAGQAGQAGQTGHATNACGRLAELAQASPAVFFQRLFAHPACRELALAAWRLPGSALTADLPGRPMLPLATTRASQIAGITLCAPAKDLLEGLAGEARLARIRYLLGLPA